jgi:hypothetical protein
VLNCGEPFGGASKYLERVPSLFSLVGPVHGLFALFRKEQSMLVYLSVLAIVIGFPLSAFAQFVDRGEYVEVPKGTKLCPNVILDSSKRMYDSENLYWQITSTARANGTQTVAVFIVEALYDRQSGETRIKDRRYDENYATFFKRDPEHKGMLLMISPKDGRVEATVEICRKKK